MKRPSPPAAAPGNLLQKLLRCDSESSDTSGPASELLTVNEKAEILCSTCFKETTQKMERNKYAKCMVTYISEFKKCHNYGYSVADSYKTEKKKNDELRQENSQLLLKIAELEKNSSNTIQQLQLPEPENHDACQAKIKDLEEKLEEANAEIRELEKVTEDFENVSNAIDNETKKNFEREKEVRELNEKLDLANQKSLNFEKRIEDLEKEKKVAQDELTYELFHIQAASNSWKKKLEDANNELIKLKKDRNQLNGNNQNENHRPPQHQQQQQNYKISKL